MKKFNPHGSPKLFHGESRGGKYQVHVGGQQVSAHDKAFHARRTANAMRKHLKANQEGYHPGVVQIKKAW